MCSNPFCATLLPLGSQSLHRLVSVQKQLCIRREFRRREVRPKSFKMSKVIFGRCLINNPKTRLALDLLADLRALGRRPQISVPSVRPKAESAATAGGADAFVSKAESPDRLMAILHNMRSKPADEAPPEGGMPPEGGEGECQ